ncbi:MAG: polysaccharide deacetylase family protein [Dongiaceae bacterium]
MPRSALPAGSCRPPQESRARAAAQRGPAGEEQSLLAPEADQQADLGPGAPLLVAVIDTEAEFDWSQPFARNLTGIANLRHLAPAQRLMERYGIRPAYMVDYAVSSQPDGHRFLRSLLDAGRCEIGAHLQPWETPPFEEPTSEANSYVGNLPLELQRRKLARLTETIARAFALRPWLYKAGRYGVSAATPALLEELGYGIDLSVLPGTDLSPQHGPDFRRCPSQPYWFGRAGALLEIPMTVGYAGLLAPAWPGLYHHATAAPWMRLRVPGLLARLGLLERGALTPEGMTVTEMCRLTQAMLRRGCRCFTLSFHSPSLMPGGTPYVRDAEELRCFMERLELFLEFFFERLGGRAASPSELRALARRPPA